MELNEEKSAIIRNGIVENIVIGNYVGVAIANQSDPEVMVLPCQRYEVAIGDTFSDGIFYHEGKAVRYLPTIEERIITLEENFRQLIEYLEKRDNLK